jgi:ribosomal RNA-processing protein 7
LASKVWSPSQVFFVDTGTLSNSNIHPGYKEHHSLTYPSKTELKQNVNAYLAHYAALEETRSKKLKQLRSEPDEDGFVTVTRGGRAGPARMEEAQAAAERLKEREKKRVGGAFYRFQTREEAKRKERELVVKFEADARKLKDIRDRRGRIRPE